MSRGFTRTTRNPSRLSSGGRDGSWRDVTTVTSCPRAASSRDRERTWLAPLSEGAVADVVLMGHLSARHQDGILHFTRVSDFRFRADRRGRPDVAVRADLRVRADDGGAFDVGAASDPRARLDEHFADEGRAAIHIGMVRALQRGEESRVRTQEIRWPPDIDPLRREAEPVDIARQDQRTDRVRDLVL